jgi:saccharopine dehydrogenase (NAD+, L-lysine-forming)
MTEPITGGVVAIVGAGGHQGGTLIELLERHLPPGRLLAIDREWGPGVEEALNDRGVLTKSLDVLGQPEALRAALSGASVVAGLAGPFYTLGPALLEAAIDTGTHYIDICDDIDATERMLGYDDAVSGAGLQALLGMGAAPGTTNILARLALDALGAAEDAFVDIAWIAGARSITPAIFGHVLHCLKTALVDRGGAAESTPDWADLDPGRVTFPDPIGPSEVVLFGHPEPLTIPRFTGARVRLRGGVLPTDYMHLMWVLARWVEGGGTREEAFRQYAGLAGLDRPADSELSGMLIDVTRDGNGYRFASATTLSMEMSTVVPTAAGVMMMLKGQVPAGLLAPECLDPAQFFSAAARFPDGGSGLTLHRIENGQPGDRLSFGSLFSPAT